MKVRTHVFFSPGGRTAVSFFCSESNPEQVKWVEVNLFTHMRHHTPTAVYDHVNGHYVAHLAHHEIGQYDDWIIKPAVLYAADLLGLTLDESLWYVEPVGCSELEEMARCSAEDRELLQLNELREPQEYGDDYEKPF